MENAILMYMYGVASAFTLVIIIITIIDNLNLEKWPTAEEEIEESTEKEHHSNDAENQSEEYAHTHPPVEESDYRLKWWRDKQKRTIKKMVQRDLFEDHQYKNLIK